MLDCLKCDTFSACRCYAGALTYQKDIGSFALKKKKLKKKKKTNIGGFEQGFRF